MMDKHSNPRPAYYTKKLCAQYIRYGDWIWFPTSERCRPDIDVVAARGENGRLSALFVHLKADPASYQVSEFDDLLSDCEVLLKIDEGTGNQVVEAPSNGIIRFQGYGVAVLTNQVTRTDETGRIMR